MFFTNVCLKQLLKAGIFDRMLCLHTKSKSTTKKKTKKLKLSSVKFLISVGTHSTGKFVFSVCAFCLNWSCYDVFSMSLFVVRICWLFFNFLKASLSQTPTLTPHNPLAERLPDFRHWTAKSKRQTSRSYGCMFIGCLCFWPLI